MPPKKADKDGKTASSSAKDEKPAGKKITDEQAEPVILEYLIKQNRPYNATDLQANLKSKHNIPKTAVVKALASLGQRGDIVEKTYGKQIIYGPKQPETTIDAADLAKIREEAAQVKAKVTELKEELKRVLSETAALESAPATSELPGKIVSLDGEISSCTTRLVDLQNGGAVQLSKADTQAIDAEFEKVKKIWLARRKAGEELCNMIVEANSISKKDARTWLEEEQGIEFDDAHLDELKLPPGLKRGIKRKA